MNITQVGFRVLGHEEADVSRQMLISLCDMFAEEVPTLAHEIGSNGKRQVCACVVCVLSEGLFNV